MRGAFFNPLFECWELFGKMMCCGSSGRRFYTRKERIEQLENLKKQLQQELAGIDEMLADLKKQEAA
ncbi:MAG TPA: hypothetical protein VNN17_02875 [Terriglobia bacterium]|nr:hypothetical protein [Terriglobia bacterium]